MINNEVKFAMFFAQSEIEKARREGKTIPRFSKKYETIYDYLKGETETGRFNPKSSTGKRIMRAALEHPAFYDLNDVRGHGKPTGKAWRIFDDRGEIEGGIMLKNRNEESKYGSYLNAVKKALDGDDIDLKKFKGKSFTDIDGKKHKFITDSEQLNTLDKFGVLPSGEDIYLD